MEQVFLWKVANWAVLQSDYSLQAEDDLGKSLETNALQHYIVKKKKTK